jgi:predicted enzyme related to lactoylglutathione lyase
MKNLDSTVLYTNNISVAVDYYTNKIELNLEYRQNDKYASFIFDNNVRLGIKKASEEREKPGSQTFFLAVNDANSEYVKAKQKDLNIDKELTDEDWGLEFSVLDPDGNKIEFLQKK